MYAGFINLIFQDSEEDKQYQQELLEKLKTLDETELR